MELGQKLVDAARPGSTRRSGVVASHDLLGGAEAVGEVLFGQAFGDSVYPLLPGVKTEGALGVDPPAPGVVTALRHEFTKITLLLGDGDDEIRVEPKMIRSFDDVVAVAGHRGFVVREVTLDEQGAGILAGNGGLDLEVGLRDGGKEERARAKAKHLLAEEAGVSTAGAKRGIEQYQGGKESEGEPKKTDEAQKPLHISPAYLTW